MNVIKRLKRRYNLRFTKIYHLGFHLDMDGIWHREVARFPPSFWEGRVSEIRIKTGLIDERN